MIRVLVVDDHELVRSGITRMLADNPDIDVIGQASSGEDAIEFVRRERPDIVLMDIRMPGIGGLEATRRILRVDDSIRVIVVTACADDPYPARVMQSGATAYITKGTVNSYRYRIFEKLEIASDVELALMAVRLGLLDADKV